MKNKDYILASHNSMTYLRPTKWWMRLFNFMAKCQRINIQEQYDLGVRMFDLRVRRAVRGLMFAHNLQTYGTHFDVIQALEFINSKKDCQVRLILEDNKYDTERVQEFRMFCILSKSKYTNIKFTGGYMKYAWHHAYNFNSDISESDIDQKVASMTGNKIDDLYPELMSKRKNKQYYSEGTDKKYLMLDFVDIR